MVSEGGGGSDVKLELVSMTQLEGRGEGSGGREGWKSEGLESVYDPCFVLPLMDWALRVAGAPAQAVCECGLLAYALVSTSSLQRSTRIFGYSCLQQLLSSLMQDKKGTDGHFSQRKQLALLLRCLRDGLEVPLQRIPCAVAVPLARASEIMVSNPGSDVYRAVNSFLLRRPYVRLREIPLINSLFTGVRVSGGGGGASNLGATAHIDPASAAKTRVWLLRGLRDGLRTSEDMGLIAKERTIPLLLAMTDCPLGESDLAVQGLVLDIMIRLASLERSGVRYLLNTVGLVAWCRAMLGRGVGWIAGAKIGRKRGEWQAPSSKTALPPQARARLLGLLRRLLDAGLRLPARPLLLLEEFALLCPEVVVSCRVGGGAGTKEGALVVAEGVALLEEIQRAIAVRAEEGVAFNQGSTAEDGNSRSEMGVQERNGTGGLGGAWRDEQSRGGKTSIGLTVEEAHSLCKAVETAATYAASSTPTSALIPSYAVSVSPRTLRLKLLALLSSPGALDTRVCRGVEAKTDDSSMAGEVVDAEALIRWCLITAHGFFTSLSGAELQERGNTGIPGGGGWKRGAKDCLWVPPSETASETEAAAVASHGALCIAHGLLCRGDKMLGAGLALSLGSDPSIALSLLSLPFMSLSLHSSIGCARVFGMASSAALAIAIPTGPPALGSMGTDASARRSTSVSPSPLLLALEPTVRKAIAVAEEDRGSEILGIKLAHDSPYLSPSPRSTVLGWLTMTATYVLKVALEDQTDSVTRSFQGGAENGNFAEGAVTGARDSSAAQACHLVVKAVPQGLKRESCVMVFVQSVQKSLEPFLPPSSGGPGQGSSECGVGEVGDLDRGVGMSRGADHPVDAGTIMSPQAMRRASEAGRAGSGLGKRRAGEDMTRSSGKRSRRRTAGGKKR
ncbi:unnamed protein product [Discosporangium mesarthrocarpum]